MMKGEEKAKESTAIRWQSYLKDCLREGIF